MSDTATAVEGVVTEALGVAPEAPSAAPATRREDVREAILSTEWKEEPEILSDRTADAQAATDVAAEGVEQGEATTQDEQQPEGESAPDDGTPPAESVIVDAAGKVVVRTPDGKFAPAPDVRLEFQVGDRTYVKSPAELVRMARDGVVGQAYREEVKQYREQVPQLVDRYQALEQELESQRALNLEILNDEGAYFARREQWHQLNSPEERLRRVEAEREQELAARRASEEQARYTGAVTSYYLQSIKPVQDEVLMSYPEVPVEAKMGKIALDTAGWLVNGVIPPHRLPEFAAYLDGPFREWVSGKAADVQSASRQAQQQQQLQQQAERRKAQQAVQTVGRQTAPTGRAAADTPAPPPPPRTRQEALERIINRPWIG